MQPHLIRSVEVRWFFPGDQNDAAWLAWFLAGNTLPLIQEGDVPREGAVYALACSPRLDRYMIVPEGGGFSIKQRQGALEVKVRQGRTTGSFSLPGITGTQEHWIKWSFTPREEVSRDAFAEDLQLSASWMDVEKTRYLIEHLHVPDQGLVPLPPESDGVVCRFELTRLNLPTLASVPAPWLTLSVEMCFPGLQPEQTLADVCRPFFEQRGPPPSSLEIAESQNYPSWLAGRVGIPLAAA